MTYDDGRVLDTMVEVWDQADGSASLFDGLWKLETRKVGDIESTGFSEIKMIGGGHFAVLQNQITKGKKPLTLVMVNCVPQIMTTIKKLD